MAKADVLARVKQDLALGHTYTATQRLRTLVAIHPTDLDLRMMLTTVYRQTGNLVEAGRWAFLSDDLTQEELLAFERANPDPWLRLRLLRWDSAVDDLPSGAARDRLRTLITTAEQTGPPIAYGGPVAAERTGRWSGPVVPCLFVLIALGGLGTLAAIGLIRILTWIIGS